MDQRSRRHEDAAQASRASDAATADTPTAIRALAVAIAKDARRSAQRFRHALSRASSRRSSPSQQRPRIAPATAYAAKRLAIVLVIGLAGLAALVAWAIHDVPLESSQPEAGAGVVIEAANGEPLGRRGPLHLAEVPLDGFPDHLIDAVLSIEDRRFYSHWGVDPRAILRSLRRNIAAGRIVEGGSTITQQLVKQMIDDDERTLRRKIREATVATWLELRLSKEEILTRYLNGVYMGSGAYGIPAAARLYFSKDVAQLTLPESALLAGLIRSPSQLNPLRNLAAAHRRAALVLRAMVDNGFIEEAEAAKARADPARPLPAAIRSEDGGWFADWIAEEAIDLSGSAQRGLRVRTTLVPAIQDIAERVVSQALDEAGAENRISQGALVALAPDGAVLAMVGGRSYSTSQFNRAVQAARQPGSAFKPFVYLAALRQGFSLRDVVEDAPIEVDGWRPENFGRYRGRVTLAEAFARSLNTATVRLALAVGIDEVARAARDLGIDAPLSETPSLALGASEVSLLELTGAYAGLRAGEGPIEPWGIAAFGAEGQGRLVSTGPSTERRPIGAQHADMVALLRSVVERGTGRGAALPGFAAGKTGTSQNFRDAWFIGFNEAMVVGVWVGNDDGSPMSEVTGGSLPAAIWRNFMMEAGPIVDDGRLMSGDQTVAANPDGARPGRCDYRACSGQYRSFRAADCSYQPYGGGPRRVCPLGIPDDVAALEMSETASEPISGPSATAGTCNVGACAAKYSSFRASDCSYQPYGGGPRRICGDGLPPDREQVVVPEDGYASGPVDRRSLTGGIVSFSDGPSAEEGSDGGGLCNMSACAAKYSSFDPANCSYQPYGGGPRRICAE